MVFVCFTPHVLAKADAITIGFATYIYVYIYCIVCYGNWPDSLWYECVVYFECMYVWFFAIFTP